MQLAFFYFFLINGYVCITIYLLFINAINMKIGDPPYILFQLQESTQKNLQKGPHSLTTFRPNFSSNLKFVQVSNSYFFQKP